MDVTRFRAKSVHDRRQKAALHSSAERCAIRGPEEALPCPQEQQQPGLHLPLPSQPHSSRLTRGQRVLWPGHAAVAVCPALGWPLRTTLHFSLSPTRILNEQLRYWKPTALAALVVLGKVQAAGPLCVTLLSFFLPGTVTLLSARSELFFCTTLLPKQLPVL